MSNIALHVSELESYAALEEEEKEGEEYAEYAEYTEDKGNAADEQAGENALGNQTPIPRPRAGGSSSSVDIETARAFEAKMKLGAIKQHDNAGGRALTSVSSHVSGRFHRDPGRIP